MCKLDPNGKKNWVILLWKVLLRSTVRGMKDLSKESSLQIKNVDTSSSGLGWGKHLQLRRTPSFDDDLDMVSGDHNNNDIFWTRTILVIVNQQSKQTLVAGGVFLLVVLLLAIATIIVSGILGNLESFFWVICVPLFWICIQCSLPQRASIIRFVCFWKSKVFQMFGT